MSDQDQNPIRYGIVEMEGDRVCGEVDTDSPVNLPWGDKIVVTNPIRLRDQVVSFFHPQAGAQAVVIPLITQVVPGVNPLEATEDPIHMVIPSACVKSITWISDKTYNEFLASLRKTGPAEQPRVIPASSLISPIPRGS